MTELCIIRQTLRKSKTCHSTFKSVSVDDVAHYVSGALIKWKDI